MTEFALNGEHNFKLGIEGFSFADLFDAARLKDLADTFYAEVGRQDEVLHSALRKYIAARGQGYERKIESKILTDSAPFLSDFIARLFKIDRERSELEKNILVQNPVWKYKFFVQRRAAKKYKPEQLAELNEAQLWIALSELRSAAFDETLVRDEELSVAEMTCRLLDAEEAFTRFASDGGDAHPIDEGVLATVARVNAAYEKLKDVAFGKLFSQNIIETDAAGDLLTVKAALQLVEAWSAAAFASKSRKWYSFKVPHPLDYQNLVHLIRGTPPSWRNGTGQQDAGVPMNIMRGCEDILRKRDGFKLTDDRGTMRDALYEIDYCLICHEREKDSCSTGLHDPDGSTKRNPLGIKTEGCPLDEKISEMHMLKKQGDSIGSLALDRHRQPDVRRHRPPHLQRLHEGLYFPKAGTRQYTARRDPVLTDVLNLPYGFEIYSLLTRWNPLNAKRPYSLPYNGKNIYGRWPRARRLHARTLSVERRLWRHRY